MVGVGVVDYRVAVALVVAEGLVDVLHEHEADGVEDVVEGCVEDHLAVRVVEGEREVEHLQVGELRAVGPLVVGYVSMLLLQAILIRVEVIQPVCVRVLIHVHVT